MGQINGATVMGSGYAMYTHNVKPSERDPHEMFRLHQKRLMETLAFWKSTDRRGENLQDMILKYQMELDSLVWYRNRSSFSIRKSLVSKA